MGLAQATRGALAELQESLRAVRGGARRVRLTQARNLHLTMKFLGETPDEQIEAALQALRSVTGRHAPFAAELAGVDAFPSRQRPRAVFAAVSVGQAPLVRLAEDVEATLADVGFAREDRTRIPHVTVARVEDARANGPLTDWIASVSPAPLGPLDGSGLILYESRLNPGGSIYTPLATLPLTGGSAGGGG